MLADTLVALSASAAILTRNGGASMPAHTQIAAARERYTLALQSALTLDEVGSAFLGTAAAVLESDAVGLYRFHETGTAPSEVLSDAEGKFLEAYETFGREDDPVLNFVMDHRRPIDSTRATTPKRWEACGARAALAEAGLTQSLEAPLVAAGQLIGTINFARADARRKFATVDLVSARMLGEQLSLAIERALRFELVGRHASMLERALDRVPEGVIVSNLDSRVVYFNRAARRIMAPVATSPTNDVTMASLSSDAASALKAGRRVHSNSIRSSDGSGHVVAKSWLQDERYGSVVTLLSQAEEPGGTSQPALAVLSTREQEIARFISEGLTSKEVAEKAFITENTVKQHLKRIFAKTDVRNRAELVQLIWSSAGRPADPVG
jgi:DNA-binding CsgD family transcriptional regulator/PAS domain-containing protein